MPERIFISYSHLDRHLVPRITQELRKRGLLKSKDVSIIDPQRDLQAGDNVREAIMIAMKSASKVVIIESKNSAESQWVNYEAGMASALGKPILVVRSRGSGKSAVFGNLHDVRTVEVGRGKRGATSKPR